MIQTVPHITPKRAGGWNAQGQYRKMTREQYDKLYAAELKRRMAYWKEMGWVSA